MWSVDIDLFGVFVPVYVTDHEEYAEAFLTQLTPLTPCRMIQRPEDWTPPFARTIKEIVRQDIAATYYDVLTGNETLVNVRRRLESQYARLRKLEGYLPETEAERLASELVEEPDDEKEEQLLEAYKLTEVHLLRDITKQKIAILLKEPKIKSKIRDVVIQFNRMLEPLDIEALEEVNDTLDQIHSFYVK